MNRIEDFLNDINNQQCFSVPIQLIKRELKNENVLNTPKIKVIEVAALQTSFSTIIDFYKPISNILTYEE